MGEGCGIDRSGRSHDARFCQLRQREFGRYGPLAVPLLCLGLGGEAPRPGSNRAFGDAVAAHVRKGWKSLVRPTTGCNRMPPLKPSAYPEMRAKVLQKPLSYLARKN